jgi:purine-binding chemotaxis protein CheW
MASAPDTTRPHAWCLFRSQSARLAIPLDRVGEVVAVDRLVPVPLSPPELLGLCTIRREVIPVVRLNCDDGQATAQATRAATVLTVRTEQHRLWGIGIHRDGITVFDETITEEGTPAARSWDDDASNTIRRGDELYTILHPDQTWAAVRGTVERWYRDSCPEDSTKLLEFTR